METGGILGRLAEKTLGWVILGLLIFLGVAIWRAGPEWRADVWSKLWRTAVWLTIAAAAPWSAKLFIRRVLEAGTNWAALGLLAALLAADVLAAIILMTAWPASAWQWLAAIGLLGIAGTYNYLVTEYLSETYGS